jgi:sulfopropanediol 3-dehydrogenase
MPRWLKRGMDASAIKAADAKVRETVEQILEQIETGRDAAVRELSQKFDGWSPPSFKLTAPEIERAIAQVAKRDLDDIKFAQAQVRNFAQKQKDTLRDLEVETLPGVVLGHKHIPVNSIGCYVPGGRYPMVASAHMSIVTARVAGVKRIAACAPPFKGGPHPAIVAAMHFGGADDIFVLGGVQAVAAMALGTDMLPAVDMIVGPGNAYVAEAKRQVSGVVGVASSFAGPSEIVVVAGPTAPPDFVAVDLVVQAEHGPDGLAWLVTWDEAVLAAVSAEVDRIVAASPRRADLESTLAASGIACLVSGPEAAMAVANTVAAEHLQLMVPEDEAPALVAQVENAGAVFIGPWAPASLGDYVAGPNHVLPVNRTARFSSALRADDFRRHIHAVSVTPNALRALGPPVITLADVEGLPAHAESVRRRLAALELGLPPAPGT